jgi:DNA-binding NarL/FixJ family response regulator
MQSASGGTVAALGTNPARGSIRIVLVEDHVILREGVKALIDLEPDLQVVGEYGEADECLEGIAALQPDLILTDLTLPGRSGIDLLGEIKRLSPNTRRTVLTAHDSEEYIRAALGEGAMGYVLKDASRVELMQAIRTVASGQQFLCRAIASKVLLGYLSERRPEEPNASPTLTQREREVLTLIALGNSNKFIARDLGVSPKTVEKHRSNLMRKLRLRNAANITMYAMRNGLLGTQAPSNPGTTRHPRAAAADCLAMPA